ncbi:MAG: creatininase family protein [Thermomicrobiales bacterium]
MTADFSLFGPGVPGRKRVFWQELWRHELEELVRHDPVAIVTTGSVEQHGPHLPLDVDIVDAHAIAAAAAMTIDDFPVVVSPPIWTGLSHYKQGHPGTITLRMETYVEVVCDVCRSIHRNGFQRIILLNGHGGNRSINQAIGIKLAEEDIFILPITYWDMVGDLLHKHSLRDGGSIGHAGEWETALQLYLRPSLVCHERVAGDEERPDLPASVRRYTAFAERLRERAGGVHGDPTTATAEQGKLLFEASRDELIVAIRAFRALPIRHYAEFFDQ